MLLYTVLDWYPEYVSTDAAKLEAIAAAIEVRAPIHPLAMFPFTTLLGFLPPCFVLPRLPAGPRVLLHSVIVLDDGRVQPMEGIPSSHKRGSIGAAGDSVMLWLLELQV